MYTLELFTIFASKTALVLNAIYSTGSDDNFNSLGDYVLTLLHINVVGEGWHEIMYLNMNCNKCILFFTYWFIFVRDC